MLERQELEAFLTLFEELHFGRTAERLHVSTARVSQTIARLERRIGAPLFTRTSRRVVPTELGKRLQSEIRPAWDRITTAFADAVATGRGGQLKVAFVGAAAGQLAVGIAQRVTEFEVELREAQPAHALALLRDGSSDLVLGELFDAPDSEPDIVAGPVLVTEARMVAVPAGHPFARRRSLTPEDLAAVTVLTGATTFEEALAQVSAGRGVLPVGAQARRYYARPDVVYVLVEGAPPVRWGLLRRAGHTTARLNAFVRAASDLVRAG